MSKQTGGKSENRVSAFLKKNIYYILMAVAVLAIVTMIIVAAVMSNQSKQPVDGPVINAPSEDTPVIDENNKPEKPDDDNKEPEKPKKVFLMTKPVNTTKIGLNYSEDKLVFHPTQGAWKTHLGIDYMANAGTEVLAAFDGKVKSIETDGYYGTVMTIEHMDGFSTVYKLLDKNVSKKVGDNVKTGEVIGKVGNNSTYEVKQGNHIHFELLKDAKLVDPNLYFVEGDK